MNLLKKNNIKWLVTALMLVIVTFLFIWRLLPYSDKEIYSSVVTTEHKYYYVIKAEGATLLYFNGLSTDSTFINLSLDKIEKTEYSMGCWVNTLPLIPSCNGTIATLFEREDSCVYDTTYMRAVINNELSLQEDTLIAFKHAATEIRYYIDTHSNKDKGYNDVVRYKQMLNDEKQRVSNIIEQLKTAAAAKTITVEKKEIYNVVYTDLNNNKKKVVCKPIITRNNLGNNLLQTCDSITPADVTPLTMRHPSPFKIKNLKDTVYIVGRSYVNDNDIMKREIEKIPEGVSGDTLRTFPRLNVIKGSPVFTRGGIFIGILSNDTIINRTVIRKTL